MAQMKEIYNDRAISVTADTDIITDTTSVYVNSSAVVNSSYIEVCVTATKAGKLALMRTTGAATQKELFNSGNDLVAGASYIFYAKMTEDDTINLQYSETDTIKTLVVSEIL